MSAGSDEIRVGLVGCGGRGTGAGGDILSSVDGVAVVAFGRRVQGQNREVRGPTSPTRVQKDKAREHQERRRDIPDDRCFVGLDAYEKLINCPDVNYVILATPPGSGRCTSQAAVAAGKNLFTEKPVAVDGPGIRKVLAAYEDAVKKNLRIVAGTQRRHQTGLPGDDEADPRRRDRRHRRTALLLERAAASGSTSASPGMTDVAYQLNNWYHFLWLCGDHIVEQHVHNLDVATGR